MSENKPGGETAADEPSLVPEASEIIGETGAAGPADAAADGVSAHDPLAELRQEMEETKSQLLRALAETENVRRRAQRDVTDARQYAVTNFARDLLSVADNFERALQTVSGIDEAEMSDRLKGLVDGVRMTQRELLGVFDRHGIKLIDPKGDRFDPNLHQAVFEVEDQSVVTGTVVQVMQPGSKIGDRVLRPAMVGVSKGGPKPGETPAGETVEAEANPEQPESGA